MAGERCGAISFACSSFSVGLPRAITDICVGELVAISHYTYHFVRIASAAHGVWRLLHLNPKPVDAILHFHFFISSNRIISFMVYGNEAVFEKKWIEHIKRHGLWDNDY